MKATLEMVDLWSNDSLSQNRCVNKTKPKAVRIFATRTLDRQQRFGFTKHIAKQLLCRVIFLASRLSLLRGISEPISSACSELGRRRGAAQHIRHRARPGRSGDLRIPKSHRLALLSSGPL